MPENMEEDDTIDPVQENAIDGPDYSADSFLKPLPNGGYINVNPEFAPYKNSIMTTGRFHIYYVHPQHGTNTFHIEQDDNLVWKSDSHPSWVDQSFINLIGDRIENRE